MTLLFSTFAAIVLLWVMGAAGCAGAARLTDARAPRDPQTGIRTGFEEIVRGPEDAATAVLLVHGHVGAPQNFGDLPAALAAEGYRVEAPLLPGHGTTPREYARLEPEDLVQSVRANLVRLKAEHDRVIVVAHSLGGAISTIVVAEEGADGLVLLAPYFGVEHQWWYGLRPETWSRLVGPLVPWAYKGELFLQLNRREAKPEVRSYSWVPMRSVITMQRAADLANAPETLDSIDCPVLWVHSPNDIAAAYTAAEAATARMTNAPRVEHLAVPEANHHLMYDYGREKELEAVVEFIATLEPES